MHEAQFPNQQWSVHIRNAKTLAALEKLLHVSQCGYVFMFSKYFSWLSVECLFVNVQSDLLENPVRVFGFRADWTLMKGTASLIFSLVAAISSLLLTKKMFW